jgi:hypothetical protein
MSWSHRWVQTEHLGEPFNPAFLFRNIRESTFLSAPADSNACLCQQPRSPRITVCSRPSRPKAGDRAKGCLLPTRETEWNA